MDVMENYVNGVDARLVVMGSQHLTSNDFNYVIGSITLSAVKRLQVRQGGLLPLLLACATRVALDGS